MVTAHGGGSREFVRIDRVTSAAGVVAVAKGRPVAILAFTISGGRIVEIDSIVNHERIRHILSSGSVNEAWKHE